MTKNKTIIIGITGGLASGKSTASGILHKLTGAPIIDADKIAHELMEPGSVCFRKIIKAFGDKTLDNNDSIDRKVLGKNVFSSPVKLKKLENILHPAIISEIIKQINIYKRSGYRMVILDAPLLIEAGLIHLTNILIVISSLKSLQIKRFAGKNKNRITLAKEIMASQMPIKEKIRFSDFHIENNFSKKELKNIIKKIITKNT